MLDEFSYRVTQLGKALGLNDQHILDTCKLELPSDIYVNLVHIDGMKAILNMVKKTYAVSKEFQKLQKTDPFCKWISKQLSNGKAPIHKGNLFLHVKWLFCKCITDSHQTFLAPVIPKACKYTLLVEANDKCGHQGTTETIV